MSAFVVSHSAVAAIVTYAQRRLWSCVPPPPHSGISTVNIRDIDPDRIGQALFAENVRSVNHRYRRTDCVPRYRHVPTYEGHVSTVETRTLTVLDILKLAHCVEYQSCEHPEWETSWARDFLQRVVDTAVHELPGYDDAPWGLYTATQDPPVECAGPAQLADASLTRVYATLADASLPDNVRREAIAALLRGCTVSDVLMHLRDACHSEASRLPEADIAREHFERAAFAIHCLRETIDI
jgi:hypothetical protein